MFRASPFKRIDCREQVAVGIAALALLATAAACSGSAESAPAAVAPAETSNPDSPSPSASVPEDPPLDFRRVMLENEGLPTKQDPAATLSQAEALEDAAFMGFFLEYGYGAFPYLQDHEHVDIRAAVAALKAHIRTKDEWTVGDLFQEVASIVTDTLGDGHATVYVPMQPVAEKWLAQGDRHWDAYVVDGLADVDTSRCSPPDSVRAIAKQSFFDAKGKTTEGTVYLSAVPQNELSCPDGGPIPLRKITPSNHRPSNAFAERELDPSTYYIRLPTLSPLSPTITDKFVASATKAGGYAHVVLDLRGNPGGDPSYFVAWLQALRVKGTLRMAPMVMGKSFAQAVMVNNLYEDQVHRVGLDDATKEHATSRLAEWKSLAHHDLDANHVFWSVPANLDVPDDEVPLATGTNTFSGDVRVLVDGACYSACEWAAQAARQLDGFSVLSETNTAGVARGSDPAPFALPNSKIVVYLPIGLVAPTGRHVPEGIGVTPTLWLDAAAMRAIYP